MAVPTFPPGVVAHEAQQWRSWPRCSICLTTTRWFVQRVDIESGHATLVYVRGCLHRGRRRTVPLSAFGKSLRPALD